jgi:hypothetical protein
MSELVETRHLHGALAICSLGEQSNNERYREAYRSAKRPHDWIQRAQEMEVAFKELKAFAATYAPIYLILPER